nr:hypothetical protein [Tanacetum cinerariifolium]
MSHDVTTHMQCIAAIVGHFSWQKVIPIYENHSTFGSSDNLLIPLSDALQQASSTIGGHSIFPPLHSRLDPSNFIEEELKKLKMKGNRVFILLQSSLRSCILLFKRAKQLGMMEKGYVWIISDNIGSLLDSIDQSLISSMQEFTNPSIHALCTYDATWAVVKAMEVSKGLSLSEDFLERVSHSRFNGLSGEIRFKDGNLQTFQPIVSLISMCLQKICSINETHRFLTANVMEDKHKPLKVGVPAEAVFNQFVNVAYDSDKNKTGTYDDLVAEVHNKVFQKGSTLAEDMSEAVLKVTQNSKINILEDNMLRSFSSSSQSAQESNGPSGLNPKAFIGLFIVSGCISVIVFITTFTHLIVKHKDFNTELDTIKPYQ